MTNGLREAAEQAVLELCDEHTPTWASDAAKADGKVPLGCAMCWPRDGHWPCISRMIADDLRQALEDQCR